ncbi:hypothetical protein [Listeria sp. PSOL-1]|uniref:hypothetical protein n=1 Tax=Listeria sp. PSOL-1 TaxID=1844999 RepID=UPI0013D46641|nr:hypothetical protein [Listeria sp. PSOL-1]
MKIRKLVASLILVIAFTQVYSFLSAVYGYFTIEKYTFVWNYWVIGFLALLLCGISLLFMRQEKFRRGAMFSLALFILYQGFSVYYYQIRIFIGAKSDQTPPFDFSGTILVLMAAILFILLFTFRKSTEQVKTDSSWKTKWRIAAAIFALISAGAAIVSGIIITLHYVNTPSENDVYFITNSFDAVFAYAIALILLVTVCVLFKRVSYILAALSLAISFLYLSNYIWMEEWARYSAEVAKALGPSETRLFGFGLIIGISSLISGIFQLVATKD